MTAQTLLLGSIVAALFGATPAKVAAQRRPTEAALDDLVRRYWLAGVTEDSTALARVTAGEQPRRVVYAFTQTSDGVTATEAKHQRPRVEPKTRVVADTAWRAYTMRVGVSEHDVPYTVRFERRCGAWRIVTVAFDEAVGYPVRSP